MLLTILHSLHRTNHRANSFASGGFRAGTGQVSEKLGRRIDVRPYVDQHAGMVRSATKRVTVNLPGDLLREAEQVTGRGITETLIEGLKLLAQRRAYGKALELRGKLDLQIDLDVSRERTRR